MKTVILGHAKREYFSVSSVALNSQGIEANMNLACDCDGDCGQGDCDCPSDCDDY